MKLLSPFLTLLRISDTDGAIIHGPLWPPAAGVRDLDIPPLPDGAASAPVPGLPGIALERTEHPRIARLAAGDRILRCEPGQTNAFLAPRQAGDFPFLLLQHAEADALSHLCAHAWTAPAIAGEAELTVLPGAAFTLDLGVLQVDLRSGMPRMEAAGGTVVVESGNTAITLVRRGPARDEILMRRAPHARWPVDAASAGEFAAHRDRALHVVGAEEVLTLPLTVCDQDRDWLFRIPKETLEQPLGRQRFALPLVRQSDKFVMLARHVEGMIFDQSGVTSEMGYLNHVGTGGVRHLPLPSGMRQEGERLFVDRGVLAECPVMTGPHAVFYGGNLSNYSHWLVDALLPLHAMRGYLPHGTRLLLPATLRGFGNSAAPVCDHHDMMRVLGLADLPAIEVDAPYCRLDDVIWHTAGAHNMPAERVRAFRDAALSLRPEAESRSRNIYIARRRTRRVANDADVQSFLGRRNFETFFLEDLSFTQQIDLFASARWVVSPHGAELGNLLFCRGGARLLELAPDIEFKPYFSYLANKLGLVHAVLPCRTGDGSFFGDMTVEMDKFESLFRMMRNRM